MLAERFDLAIADTFELLRAAARDSRRRPQASPAAGRAER
jgi:hypothetical protein